MIGRVLVVGLVLVTTALMQTSLVPFLALGGYRPDLLLLVTIAFALREGLLPGLRIGFVAGLLSDLLRNQSPVGLTALVFVGVVYAIGIARPYLATESLTAPLLLASFGTLLGVGGYGVLGSVMGESPFSFDAIVQASIVSAVYATLLAPFVFAIVRFLATQFPAETATRPG